MDNHEDEIDYGECTLDYWPGTSGLLDDPDDTSDKWMLDEDGTWICKGWDEAKRRWYIKDRIDAPPEPPE